MSTHAVRTYPLLIVSMLNAGNLRTSDRGGPYNLTLLPVQMNEIKGASFGRLYSRVDRNVLQSPAPALGLATPRCYLHLILCRPSLLRIGWCHIVQTLGTVHALHRQQLCAS